MSQFSEMDKRSRKETEKKRGRCASDFPYPSLTAVRSPTSPQTLKPLSGERLWRNLPSIFLIQHDFARSSNNDNNGCDDWPGLRRQSTHRPLSIKSRKQTWPIILHIWIRCAVITKRLADFFTRS